MAENDNDFDFNMLANQGSMAAMPTFNQRPAEPPSPPAPKGAPPAPSTVSIGGDSDSDAGGYGAGGVGAGGGNQDYDSVSVQSSVAANGYIPARQPPPPQQSYQPPQQPQQKSAPSPAVAYDPEEMRRQKFKLLAVLRFYESRGMPITRKFTINDNYNDIAEEVKIIKSTYEMDRNIGVAKKGLVFVTGLLEWANEKYQPLDIKLKGWADSLDMDKDDYDDVLRELLEKHDDKVQALMSPEMVFLMMYASSASAIHQTNASRIAGSSPRPPPPQQPHQQQQRAAPARRPPVQTGNDEIDSLTHDLP